jgi:hypothetical protein
LKFANGTVHSIRSISQRALALYWARLGKNQGTPSFDQFEPGPRIHDPKQLVIWKVEAGLEEIAFRALYRGSLVGEAVNEGWVGKTLVEVTPPSIRSAIVRATAYCAGTGCAIYTVLRTCDAAGHSVDLERLLLPFGKNGRVSHVVASLQLISLEGVVERRKIVGNFETHSGCVLSVAISAASFGESNPRRTLKADTFVGSSAPPASTASVS